MTAFSTFTYAKKYFVSSEIEFVTEPDADFGETYKPPQDLINLLADNLIVYDKVGIGTTTPSRALEVIGDALISGITTFNRDIYLDGPLRDRFRNKGTLGQVLLSDGNSVFWGDVSGVGTPLQTIGIYDEGNFIGTVSNLNFLDGTDQNNLVSATIGLSSSFANIVVSDRWSLSGSDVYRMSSVGIQNSNPTSTLDITGTLHATDAVDFDSTLNVDGATTLNDTLDVIGITTLRNQLIVGGATSIASTLDVDGATILNNTLDVIGITTLRNQLIVGGATSIASTLDVDLATTLNSTLDVDLATTLNSTLDVDGATTLNSTLDVDGDTTLNSTLDVDLATTLNSTLDVDLATTLNSTLDVDGATTLNNTLQVGVGGTVITTTGIGSVGFGINSPKRDIQFKEKDVFFDGGAIYDTNENVGFRSEQYQVPRNVLTTVGVDTGGNIIGGRFFDAANLIRLNLDFIANETVGFLTSTDYKNPAFVVVNSSGVPINPVNCKDDIKDILKAITYDITRGGNSRSVGAGLSYYSGNTLLHITGNDTNGYSVKSATIAAIEKAKEVSRYVINNLPPITSYQGIGSVSLIRDLTLQDDPLLGSNTDPDGCANVVSAIYTCAGIVTTIINSGPSAAPNITYPDGKIVWAPAGADSRNLIYVSKYGNDDNNGRTEGAAKLTIGAAAAVAQSGDTIMVRSGVYAENNPIGLRTDVSVSGQDLRLVTIYPQNDDDVFYVRRGCLIENLSFAYSKDPYDDSAPIRISGASVAFPPLSGENTAKSGYLDPGPADEGPTGRWRSPYIRNCTNFMSGSIGMKIDGNHATANTIGNDLKCMVLDSFTQYNEGGIGVSITNNGYAQLVSLFTICSDISVYCDTGGSCDLTNSNSSFGNFGLVAVGLGSTEFTGIVSTFPPTRTSPGVDAGSDIVTFANVKDKFNNPRRPFDGQSLFFKINLNNYADAQGSGVIQEPMVQISQIRILNGGSGFSDVSPPNVIIRDKNDLSQQPKGPQGIIAELSPTVDETGKIVTIDVVNSGRNYLSSQELEVFIDGGESVGAAATVITQPIYYTIDAATEVTSTGISTVTFNEFIPYELFGGEQVSFKRISRILTSSHSFEYIGTGVDINNSTPFQGAVPIKENEIVALDGAQIPFTSTDQKGNFDIGEGFQINQPSAIIRGRDFSKAIQAEVTPLILALR